MATGMALPFIALMLLAAAWDVATLTIPNRLSLALVFGFPPAAWMAGLPTPEVLVHVGCGFSILIVGFLLFSAGVFGGGDAKLLAAAALWIGGAQLIVYMMLTVYAGGLLAVAVLVYRRLPLPGWLAERSWAARLHDRKSGIPYGVAIAAGAVGVLPATVWMH